MLGLYKQKPMTVSISRDRGGGDLGQPWYGTLRIGRQFFRISVTHSIGDDEDRLSPILNRIKDFSEPAKKALQEVLQKEDDLHWTALDPLTSEIYFQYDATAQEKKMFLQKRIQKELQTTRWKYSYDLDRLEREKNDKDIFLKRVLNRTYNNPLDLRLKSYIKTAIDKFSDESNELAFKRIYQRCLSYGYCIKNKSAFFSKMLFRLGFCTPLYFSGDATIFFDALSHILLDKRDSNHQKLVSVLKKALITHREDLGVYFHSYDSIRDKYGDSNIISISILRDVGILPSEIEAKKKLEETFLRKIEKLEKDLQDLN
jgi:hypothetical protein